MFFRSIKSKIILASTICVLVVGIVSSFYTHNYLNKIITEKSDTLDSVNMTSVKNQLNVRLRNFENLASLCSNDLQIASAMQGTNMDTLRNKKALISALSVLNTYFVSNEGREYIEKMLVFNDNDLTAQLFISNTNTMQDVPKIRELPIYKELAGNIADNHNGKFTLSSSIVSGKETLAYLRPIYNFSTGTYTGWFYIEVNADWISSIFSPYPRGQYVVTYGNTTFFPSNVRDAMPENFSITDAIKNEDYQLDKNVYRVKQAPLISGGFNLYSISNVTFIERDSRPALYTIIIGAGSAIVLGMILMFILSNIITTPLTRLTNRIHKIAGNDFSYDPTIEEGKTELAEAGRMINEMSGGISNLIKESEESYVQQKNAEISLLQSQVNPHFLYNTLDSINWMATIQKSSGIMAMTRSLSNLMKNLSKGTGDIISLAEEIALAEDYVKIQTIRYMESFQMINKISPTLQDYTIIKFTLQPIIENAIFHGIVPAGGYGTIVLDAVEEADCILLTIEDDGVGMSESEIENLFKEQPKTSGTQLSGIGVRNVHERLRLHYGKGYGLSYESALGEYTRATLRIPKKLKEGPGDVSDSIS